MQDFYETLCVLHIRQDCRLGNLKTNGGWRDSRAIQRLDNKTEKCFIAEGLQRARPGMPVTPTTSTGGE